MALVDIIKAICPKCGGESHFLNWDPGDCPRCGACLEDFTYWDLKAQRACWEIKVNPLTGEPVVERVD